MAARNRSLAPPRLPTGLLACAVLASVVAPGVDAGALEGVAPADAERHRAPSEPEGTSGADVAPANTAPAGAVDADAAAPARSGYGMRARFGREPITTGDGAGGTGGAGGTSEDLSTEAYRWRIPAWLPPPPVPADNPMSEAKVALGRHLFHDRRLSADGAVACASCHDQALAFSDGRARGVGIGGSVAHRNSMGLANVGYSPRLTWANPHMVSLERQALVPLFGEEPLEMGNGGRERELFARVSADPLYREMFLEAFPEEEGRVDLKTLTRALAAFQRSLVSVDSPYDRYKYGGDGEAMSASALRGESLFFSETLECYHCHQGFNFTDTTRTSRGGFDEVAFHNTGLYDTDGRGAYPPHGQGLRELTGKPVDMGRFRTPSLRNVAVTAPYFHDGSAATLDEVIDHYAAGGRTVSGEHAGNGALNPFKDSLVKGFSLSASERADLLAFLDSLTDERFLLEPAFSDPWPPGHPARGTAPRGASGSPSTPDGSSTPSEGARTGGVEHADGPRP